MIVKTAREGSALTIFLNGRLDSEGSELTKRKLMENIDGVTRLTFDLTKLEYLTSAGLRVLISAQKIMDRQGEMQLIHVNEDVRDVLAMTGMLDILTVVAG